MLGTQMTFESALHESGAGIKLADYAPKNMQWEIGWTLITNRLGPSVAVAFEVSFRGALSSFQNFMHAGFPKNEEGRKLFKDFSKGEGRTFAIATAGTIFVGGITYLLWPYDSNQTK